ncbi:nuclear transport factor 2 family protein [Paenibacillus medicaginis]|uniref:Nuclear transport factor 2 family protein n=1 Tax=Paenibacillus medicaginis TaxID=1470560 RepID=A0ABV5BZV1_9BACL
MNNAVSDSSTKAMEILNRMFAVEMEFMRSDGSDFSGIKSAFHPDIVVHEPVSLPYPGDWCGYEGLGRLFKIMHNTWSSMNTENILATLDGDTLFMGCTLVARTRQSEIEVRLPFAQILKMKDGLVIEAFPYYFDTAMINAALGCVTSGRLNTKTASSR